MRKNRSFLFFIICLALILIGVIEYINYKRVIITDYTKGPGKVIYEYVKERNGEEVANKIKIKDSRESTEEYGHRYDIYRYADYTGTPEMVYFFLKQDANNNWSIIDIKTLDDFVNNTSQ